MLKLKNKKNCRPKSITFIQIKVHEVEWMCVFYILNEFESDNNIKYHRSNTDV